jgi:hypothetical protein
MCIKLVIEKLIDIMMHGHRNIKIQYCMLRRKSLDTRDDILNIEFQVTFAPPCVNDNIR